MPYAIELYFDSDAEKRIIGVWKAIAKTGIRSLLLEFGSRPHLSLAVFEAVEAEALTTAVGSFSKFYHSFDIELASVGCFARRHGVAFLAPILNHDLRSLHEDFHRDLQKLGLKCNEFYIPGAWVPHCTIAQEVNGSELAKVVEIALAGDVLGCATCTEIAVVRYRPVQAIFNRTLEKRRS